VLHGVAGYAMEHGDSGETVPSEKVHEGFGGRFVSPAIAFTDKNTEEGLFSVEDCHGEYL
jgi:hypothetical protein